jgi:hypothetical protein
MQGEECRILHLVSCIETSPFFLSILDEQPLASRKQVDKEGHA